MSKQIEDTRAPITGFRPLALCAIGIITGMTIAYRLTLQTVLIFVIVFIALGVTGLLIKQRGLCIILLAAALGALRLLAALPTDFTAGNHELAGRVAEPPDINEFVLDNVTVDGKSVNGRILLYLKRDLGDGMPRYGDRIEAAAYIAKPVGSMNEGGFDNRTYLLTLGIGATANADTLRVTARGGGDIYGACLNLRESVSSAVRELFPTQYGLIQGILIGDESYLSEERIQAFRDTGTAHLLAVSGLHVSIAAGALLLVTKKLRPVIRFALLCAFLAVYCALVGFSASIVRASVMLAALTLGQALGRRSDTLSSLSLAAIVILAVSPFQLFSLGFRLSFCAVLGIALTYKPLCALTSALPKAVREPLALSAAAQLGTMPASISTFNRLPLLSLVANLIIVPLSPLMLLPSLIAVPLYYIFPPAAKALAVVGEMFAELAQRLASAIASVPGGTLCVASPGVWAVAAFWAALICVSPFLYVTRRQRLRLCALALALCAALLLLPALNNGTTVTVLHERGGAPVCLELGGEYCVIDAGGGREMSDWLDHHGVRSLKCVFARDRAQAYWAAGFLQEGSIETVYFCYDDAALAKYLTALGASCATFDKPVKLSESAEILPLENGYLLQVGAFSLCTGNAPCTVRISAKPESNAQGVNIVYGTKQNAPDGSEAIYLSETGQLSFAIEAKKFSMKAYLPQKS